jgi:hypothetical protein
MRSRGPAELRLEDDDEREEADDGARLEDLGQPAAASGCGPRSRRRTATVHRRSRGGTALVPRMRLNSPVDQERRDPECPRMVSPNGT